MCEYFSCVIDRNLKVHWCKDTVEHEKIIQRAELEDDKLEDRDFVRIEITPKNGIAHATRNKKDWQYMVDEQGTLPKWYLDNEEKCQKLCWRSWKKSVNINILLGKEKATCRDQIIFVLGNSTVEAWGNSTVEAWGNSTVEAWGNSTVHKFYGSVELFSDMAVIIDVYNNQIFVTKKAKIIRVKKETLK